MAVQDRLGERAGTTTLYLLFAGRHSEPTRAAEALVAAFASQDEARAAFRQARLRLSDAEGWAELAVVTDGATPRPVSWFGQGGRRRPQPFTWPLTGDGHERDAVSPSRWSRLRQRIGGGAQEPGA